MGTNIQGGVEGQEEDCQTYRQRQNVKFFHETVSPKLLYTTTIFMIFVIYRPFILFIYLTLKWNKCMLQRDFKLP